MNSGNTDNETAINDYYISPLAYRKSPNIISKKQQINLYFSHTSSGTLYYEDRSQFSSLFTKRCEFTLTKADSLTQIRQTIDIPETCNVYQFKLSSSANKADSWQCNFIDYTNLPLGIGKP